MPFRLVGLAAHGHHRHPVFKALAVGKGGGEFAHRTGHLFDLTVELDVDLRVAGDPGRQIIDKGQDGISFPVAEDLAAVAAEQVALLNAK